MNKSEVFLKKHSPTILTLVGSIGVVATSVLAVKATPKAMTLLEKSREEKGGELTISETVKAGWKPYIPAAITGVSTIACIFGANMLNSKNQASLMSAYAVLDQSYKEYQKHTKNHYVDEEIKREIIENKFDKNMKVNNDKELFFDYQSMQFFTSTFEEVKTAELLFNEEFLKTGYACLNDFYDILGIDGVSYGTQLGWSVVSGNYDDDMTELAFDYEKFVLDDESEEGLEYTVITMPNSPSIDYIY